MKIILLILLLMAGVSHASPNQKQLIDELNTLKAEAEKSIVELESQTTRSPTDQLTLARRYMEIIPATHASKVPPLREKAWHWYTKAMQQSVDKKASRTAEKELAYSYYVEEREDKLREMIKGRYPEAYYQLAMLLLKNNPDSVEAIKKLESLGKQHTKAAEKLADQYNNPFVKYYDVRKSYQWHKEAAKKGDPKYIYELARMYHHGFGDQWPEFKMDIKQANQHYLKAANYGNVDAQIYLVSLFRRVNNYKNAHLLADELIKQKQAEGYFHKGEMFFQGQGVNVDKTKAIQLMGKAKAMDYHPAISALAAMEAQR